MSHAGATPVAPGLPRAFLVEAFNRILISQIRFGETGEEPPFRCAAFIEESGEALIWKHASLDPLFTPEGYCTYADDLLARTTNPYLQDTAERVGRDPQHKLGWDDRLIGAMRVAAGSSAGARRGGQTRRRFFVRRETSNVN